MSDKLIEDVKAIVDDIFKQQEEVAMRKETEEALTQSAEKINELTASLEAKDKELEEVAASVEEFEKTVSELTDKVKELTEEKSSIETEKEELIEKAEKLEAELEAIKKDQLAATRFAELKAEKVAASTDDTIKMQLAKLRDMSDDEFAAYKEERIELRNELMKELSDASDQTSGAVSDSDDATNASDSNNSDNSSDTSADADGSDDSVNANVDGDGVDDSSGIDAMKAVASLLNLNTSPDDSVVSKYRELGKALAAKLSDK